MLAGCLPAGKQSTHLLARTASMALFLQVPRRVRVASIYWQQSAMESHGTSCRSSLRRGRLRLSVILLHRIVQAQLACSLLESFITASSRVNLSIFRLTSLFHICSDSRLVVILLY